jgi:hypothetical protein
MLTDSVSYQPLSVYSQPIEPYVATTVQPLSVYSQPIEPYVATTVTNAEIADREQEKWVLVIRALQSLGSLQDNWDGLGAAAPAGRLVQSAVELAEALRRRSVYPPATAVATQGGTILFGWNGSTYFEIEIAEPYRAEWMLVDECGAAKHGNI